MKFSLIPHEILAEGGTMGMRMDFTRSVRSIGMALPRLALAGSTLLPHFGCGNSAISGISARATIDAKAEAGDLLRAQDSIIFKPEISGVDIPTPVDIRSDVPADISMPIDASIADASGDAENPPVCSLYIPPKCQNIDGIDITTMFDGKPSLNTKVYNNGSTIEKIDNLGNSYVFDIASGTLAIYDSKGKITAVYTPNQNDFAGKVSNSLLLWLYGEAEIDPSKKALLGKVNNCFEWLIKPKTDLDINAALKDAIPDCLEDFICTTGYGVYAVATKFQNNSITFFQGGSGGTGGGGWTISFGLYSGGIQEIHNGFAPSEGQECEKACDLIKGDPKFKQEVQKLIDSITGQAKKTIPLTNFTNLIRVIKKLIDYQSSL